MCRKQRRYDPPSIQASVQDSGMGRRPHQVQVQPCCRPSVPSPAAHLTEGRFSFLLCNMETVTVPTPEGYCGAQKFLCVRSQSRAWRKVTPSSW